MSIDWIGRADALKLQVRNFVGGRWQDAAAQFMGCQQFCGLRFESCASGDPKAKCRLARSQRQRTTQRRSRRGCHSDRRA